MSDANQQAALASAFFAGAQTVGLDMRQPPADLGRTVLRVTSMRFHNGIGGAGVITEGVQESDGTTRGFRIQLGGKFPAYGIRDTKALVAACLGLERSDPRAAAIDQTTIAPYLIDGPGNPAIGKRIVLNTTESKKIDEKTGRPYRNSIPSCLEASDGAQAPATAVASISTAPTPPAAPAAPWAPPVGWAPNGDTGWYYQTANPTGEQKTRAALGGPA